MGGRRVDPRSSSTGPSIGTRAEAEAVAAALLAHTHYGLRRTSISSALTASAALFEDNGFTSFRQVIDVSGDGPNNHGAPVTRARDTVLAQGIVINGLPLMTRDTFGGMWHLDDLDAYYAACVIGGPGAFVLPVHDWSEFPAAVRRKLVLEIAGARAARAAAHPGAGRGALRLPDRREDLGAQPRPVGLAVTRRSPGPSASICLQISSGEREGEARPAILQWRIASAERKAPSLARTTRRTTLDLPSPPVI